MRRQPTDGAPDVRAFLERMAAEAPAPGLESGPVLGRARRRVAATVAGMFLLAAVLVSGIGIGLGRIAGWSRTVPGVTETPSPPAPASVEITGRFRQGDLRGLALQTSERPTGYGLRHEPSYAYRDTLTGVATTLDISTIELAEAGFVTAFFNGFVSDAWNDPDAPPADRVDLVSYAILFPDAEAAHVAFGLFRVGPTTSPREDWTSEPMAALGDEGITSNGLLSGVPTTTVVWRVDNVILFVASQGFAEAIPLHELLPLAERIDARAA